MYHHINTVASLPAPPWRIGAIRFLNTTPLIFDLHNRHDITLDLDVPANLGRNLDQGRYHASLVSSIDYQLSEHPWRILPINAIGSNHDVLTVRLFSTRPPEQIRSLACDPDSHTARTLLQILWKLQYNRTLDMIPLDDRPEDYDAVLLIGDKVLPHLNHWPCEIDLGQLWRSLTNLPFVYAVWAVPQNLNIDPLVPILDRARRLGFENLDSLVNQHAAHHGFTPHQAHTYLTQNLCFDFGTDQLRALTLFYELAQQLGIIPSLRPIDLYPCQNNPLS